MVSVAGSTRSSVLRIRRSAPGDAEDTNGPGTLFNRSPLAPVLPRHGRERDLSGFLAILPIPLPCSKTPA